MTTIATARIRAGRGRLRVLRVIVHHGRLYLDRYRAVAGMGTCRVCGCTAAHACPPTCVWTDATRTLCSRCAGRGRPDGH